MPQLDSSVYITQIFWLLITFISFWFIMDRILLPKIGEKIEERKRKYNDNIQKAEEINKKALDTLKNCEEKLAVAMKDATTQINKNEEELETFIREKEDEINLKLKQRIAESEKDLSSEMTKVITKVDEMANNLALVIAERLELNSLKEDIIDSMNVKTGVK